MPFLNEEYTNFSLKGWLGLFGTGDRYTAPDNLSWYEEQYSLDSSIKSTSVLLDFTTIPPANTAASAVNASIVFPSVIQNYASGSAVHLTPSLNQKAFLITTTYGDLDTRVGNWIMPQLISMPVTGLASWGYSIHLWNGDPNLPGSIEINTSVGQDPGTSRVGWFIHYGSGIIKVASDFDFTGEGIDPTDVWVTGFRYIGRTADSLGSAGKLISDVTTVATVGETVSVDGYGSNMTVSRITLTSAKPPLGIVSATNKVTTLGLVEGLAVQNFILGSSEGKVCFIDSSGRPDTIPTTTSGEYIKTIGLIVSATQVYVSPSTFMVQRA